MADQLLNIFHLPWKDPFFYVNRNKADDKKYQNNPYYGIRGINRVSNLTIVFVCVSLASFVFGLQVLAIRNSFTFKRDEIIKRSNEAKHSLRQVREVAAENGNQLQVEIVKQKFANAAKYKDKT